jgi:Protein of unknown function (DUF2511)
MSGRVTFLVLVVWCTACGADTTRTEHAGAAAVIAANQRSVASTDFGTEWPFTVNRGVLACVDGSAVVFTASGVTYALNDRARGQVTAKGWREADTITRTTQMTGVASVARLDDAKRREIFRAYIACEEANPSPGASDSCKRGLQTKYTVSAQELSTISTEGLSHSWPPLKPIYVSIQPIITAGLALCGK